MQESLEKLKELIESQGKLVVFTGAGMSTESGIPDFRSPGGVWSKHQPIMYQDFLASKQARQDYWAFYLDWFPGFVQAQPHQGHVALGRLYQAGLLGAVVTQNVDGLHQAGGVADADVVEIHGSVFTTACLDCQQHQEPTNGVLDRVQAGEADPACPSCGGCLKPSTISFGQGLVPQDLQRAAELCAAADPLLVVGSSLVVTPAAELPLATLARGGSLAIINHEPTPLDERASLLFRDPAGEVLAALAGNLLKDV